MIETAKVLLVIILVVSAGLLFDKETNEQEEIHYGLSILLASILYALLSR